MKESLVILLILGFLCLALGAFALEIRRAPLETTFVDSSLAFVYPAGDEFVLVLAQGEYLVDGTTLPTGCYELHPAGLFMDRGYALWTGMECPVLAAGK
jgi:hypothetical protein